jgi:RNA recognition motif-containing protein
MDTFSQYAQIKDIRMIKDKSGGNGEYRDFAFIEFFTIEDATFVLERSK